MGTAGHVDHGKTSLIKALTGIDCDRLIEEKEREITIDIGFAYMPIGDNRTIGIVDVPGHERFIKNMLAGVTGIDFVLMVIAADDGVMPQTLEHLDICSLLHVQKGIIAITKTDLVEPGWAEIVADDVRKAVAGTFLESAPIVPVSSTTKDGIKELSEAIKRMADTIRSRDEWGPVRLPIDRAFVMKGAGTVVTGTLVSGTLALNQELVLLPEGRETRVRHIQVHGKKHEEAGAGQRVAVNLTGVDVGELHRGETLAAPGFLNVTRMLDVKIQSVGNLVKPVANRTRVRLYIGTQEIIGRVKYFDRTELAAGAEAYARLRLETPMVCARRDLFIIRKYSPLETIGGGMVLDANPNPRRRDETQILIELKRKEQGAPDEVVEQAVSDFGFKPVNQKDIVIKANLDPQEVGAIVADLITKNMLISIPNTDKVITRVAFERLKTQILSRFREYFSLFAKKPWVTQQEIKTKYFAKEDMKAIELAVGTLVESGKLAVSVSGRGLRHVEGSEDVINEEERLRIEIERIYIENKLNAPSQLELPSFVHSDILDINEVFQTLVDSGELIKLASNSCIHREAAMEAKKAIVDFIQAKGEITVGDVRDMLGTSRKVAVPLMEYFDTQRVTYRKGDSRTLYPKR
jgi:selenocysteine-specific elongation factor